MHLGELGTRCHASVMALMVPDQLIGSICTNAKCWWACVELTLQSFEQSGIPSKAKKPQAYFGQEKLGGGPHPAVLGVW